MTLVRRKVFRMICVIFFAMFLNGCDILGNFSSATTTTTSMSTTISTTLDSIITTEVDITESTTPVISTSTVTTNHVTTESTITTQSSLSTTTTNQSSTNLVTTTNQETTTQQTTTSSGETTTVTYTYLSTTTLTTTQQTTTEEEFLITFNSEEGSEIDPMHYTVSSSFILPEPEREYYFFRGWYLDSNYSGNPITEIIPGMIGDMVLYAKWEEDYSYFILNFLGDFLVIPEHCLYVDGDEVRIIQEHVDDFMEVFGYYLFDINSPGLSFDFETILNLASGDLESVIIHATVSKLMLEMIDDYELPYYSIDGEVIRYVDSVDMVEYISADELLEIFNVFSMFGYTNLNLFLNDLFTARFNLNVNLDTMFSSSIAHYAFSQVLLDFIDYNILLIPSNDIDMNPIIITYGEGDTLTEYLALTEIEAFVEAMKIIGISELETFSGDLYLDVLSEDNLNQILSSVIMHTSISQQIFDSGVLGDYEPESIIDYYTSDLETIKVIDKEEILRYARACKINGIHGFYYYDFNTYEIINLAVAEQQELLSSVIVRYSITPHLEDLALVINYSLSADDYDGLSTDNCLTVSTIIEILEAYDEFLN